MWSSHFKRENMKNVPLFLFDDMPRPLKMYLKNFGWHFNKAACMYAVSMMWKKDGQGKRIRIKWIGKEQVDELLKKHNIDLENKNLYDYVYAYHMVVADNMGLNVDDEKHVMLSVKALVDDVDKPGGRLFWHWYWDEVYDGRGVEFEDFMEGSDD